MLKITITFVYILQTFICTAQIKRDTSFAKNQMFGALGLSLLGYNNDTKSYLSIYWQTGVEYNYTKSIKLGFAWSLIKLNWTNLQPDSLKFGQKYDWVRYFSFSSDIQIFGRFILSRTKDEYKSYNKYLELGLGYNIPYYFALNKIKGENKIIEIYPNSYNDAYLYTTFYFLIKKNIPLGIKFEYHPFDIIKNNYYPDVAKFRVDILISLFTENNDEKK